MSHHPIRLAATMGVLTVLASACGLPSDGGPQVIAPERVPEELASSPEDDSALVPERGDDLANVFVFDEDGETLQVVAVPAEDGGAAAVLALLDDPELTEFQTNFLPTSLELEGYQFLDSNKVLLELSTGLEEIVGPAQAKAIAQLVYTVSAAEPRATGLAIEVGGKAIQLPDDSLEAADVVWTDDYSSFTLFAEN